jgi:hypothetical protein
LLAYRGGEPEAAGERKQITTVVLEADIGVEMGMGSLYPPMEAFKNPARDILPSVVPPPVLAQFSRQLCE